MLARWLAVQDTGRSPFYVICETGNDLLLDSLLAFGGLHLRANVQTRTGLTPVHAAALNNHAGIVTALAGLGVDVNLANVGHSYFFAFVTAAAFVWFPNTLWLRRRFEGLHHS